MRTALGFNIEERRRIPTWTDALRRFIEQADLLGVLVMISGVVGSNNRRKLDPLEFRGFALSDDVAPLVFINGADTKAAQMFTLAHEIAHIWLGQSALSDVEAASMPEHRVEIWCNQVAAELLVPIDVLRTEYSRQLGVQEECGRLARFFKVSTLVILRRLHDAGFMGREALWQAYDEEVTRLRAIPRASGGDFYLTQAARVSKRFARALVASTLEGQTLHRDAFRLLGFSKLETFRELGRSVGVA
jgi:Zn-dependent peptidase ImmA (M78 family)